MPTGIKVKDAMVSDVVTAVATQTVLDASKIMKENDVGSVIVVENNKPIGIVTREDIVNKVTAENKLPEVPKEELLTSEDIYNRRDKSKSHDIWKNLKSLFFS